MAVTQDRVAHGKADWYPVWLVILAAATVAAIGMGLRQVMALYLVPVSVDLAAGREIFAFSVALSNIVWGIAAPFTGAVSDRYGTGRVVVFGGIMTVAGLYALHIATTPMHIYLAGVLLGFGVAGAGVNSVVGAVGRAAAPEDRTAAIAAVGMGSGVGILLVLPYSHLLIEALSWRTSLLVLMATALFILPLALLVRRPPSAHGDPGEKVSGRSGDAEANAQGLGEALGQAFRYPSFWLLNAGFFVCGFHVVFYGTHLPAFVSDQGLGQEVAVTALIAVGVGNLIGTYVAGQWGRFLPKRYGLALIYGGRAVVFLGFLVLPMTAPVIIALSAVLGLLWLSTIPLTSGLVATFFGAKWMTMLYGIVFFSHQLGSFAGVWLAGAIYDDLQSYDAMWWISVGLGLAAMAVHWPIREAPAAGREGEAGTAAGPDAGGVPAMAGCGCGCSCHDTARRNG